MSLARGGPHQETDRGDGDYDSDDVKMKDDSSYDVKDNDSDDVKDER